MAVLKAPCDAHGLVCAFIRGGLTRSMFKKVNVLKTHYFSWLQHLCQCFRHLNTQKSSFLQHGTFKVVWGQQNEPKHNPDTLSPSEVDVASQMDEQTVVLTHTQQQ